MAKTILAVNMNYPYTAMAYELQIGTEHHAEAIGRIEDAAAEFAALPAVQPNIASKHGKPYLNWQSVQYIPGDILEKHGVGLIAIRPAVFARYNVNEPREYREDQLPSWIQETFMEPADSRPDVISIIAAPDPGLSRLKSGHLLQLRNEKHVTLQEAMRLVAEAYEQSNEVDWARLTWIMPGKFSTRGLVPLRVVKTDFIVELNQNLLERALLKKSDPMIYQFQLNIGDVFGDGHGKSQHYIVNSNAPVERVREAHYQILSKTGVDIEGVCSCYQEDEIDEETVELLEELGFVFENASGMGKGITNADEFAKLYIFLLQKADSRLALNIQRETIPMLHFPGNDASGRHIGVLGYGLFR